MTQADLIAQAAAAKPGSTIVIPPGNYGAPYLKGLKSVTFKADPAAMFDGLTLYGCQDVNWSGGHFEFPSAIATDPAAKIVRIAACHGGSFTDATILGAIATLGVPENSPTTGSHLINGRPAGIGIVAEMTTSDFILARNDISRAFKGIALSTTGAMTITDNHIHDFRTSGIVGDCHDSLIARNHIHIAHQWAVGGNGDHSDGIHLFNAYKAAAPAANITISKNWIDQDTGDAIPIGILIEGDSTSGFTNLIIDQNTILNGNAQAIAAWHVVGLSVTGNVCLQTAGNANDAPSMRFAGSTDKVLLPPGIVLNGNAAADVYKLFAATAQTEALGLTPMKNTIVPAGLPSTATLAAARAKAKALLTS